MGELKQKYRNKKKRKKIVCSGCDTKNWFMHTHHQFTARECSIQNSASTRYSIKISQSKTICSIRIIFYCVNTIKMGTEMNCVRSMSEKYNLWHKSETKRHELLRRHASENIYIFGAMSFKLIELWENLSTHASRSSTTKSIHDHAFIADSIYAVQLHGMPMITEYILTITRTSSGLPLYIYIDSLTIPNDMPNNKICSLHGKIAIVRAHQWRCWLLLIWCQLNFN